MGELDKTVAMSLYDQMLNTITGRDPSAGLPSAYDPATTYLTLEQKGRMIYTKDYLNPWSPGNPNGNPDALVNITTLVDGIPNRSPVHADSSRKVSDVYTRMVKGVMVTEPPPDPAVAKRRAEALKKRVCMTM
jgi:hypothetical protein